MILRAVSDSTPPPDLTVSLTLTGGKLLEPIILERKAEDPLPLPPPCSNRPQAVSSQGSKSHEENKTSNSDKDESQVNSAEPSQDSGAGLHADSDPAPLPVSLSHSPSSIQSGTESSQQKGTCVHAIILTDKTVYYFDLDNDQPETTGTSSNGTVDHQELDIVKDYFVVEK